MMSQKLKLVSIIACFAVLLPACSGAGDKAVTPETADTGALTLPNIIVEVEGRVMLRRSGWTEFVQVGFGVQVSPGDLIRLEPGSRAAVFCGEESLWDTGPTDIESDALEHGIPCQSGRPPRPWVDVASLRDETDEQRAYAIRPLDSALLESKPNLRWNVVPQQQSDSGVWLSVIGDDGQDRPPVEVAGLEEEWPDVWPELEPGATYIFTVSLDEASTSLQGASSAGMGFWLLNTDEAAEVRDQEANLRARPLSAEAKDLLVAELYLSHGLNAEAIELLEAIDSQDHAPLVALLLGQVYLDLGLLNEAEAALLSSSELAALNGELEAEAEALIGLGMIASAREDPALANQHYGDAKQLFGSIGNEDGVEQVEQMMNE